MKKVKIPYLQKGGASLRVFLMRLAVSVCGAALLLFCLIRQSCDLCGLRLLQDAFFRRGFFCLASPRIFSVQFFQSEFSALGSFLILL